MTATITPTPAVNPEAVARLEQGVADALVASTAPAPAVHTPPPVPAPAPAPAEHTPPPTPAPAPAPAAGPAVTVNVDKA